MAGKRKVYPQMVVAEVLLAVVAGGVTYALSHAIGAGASLAAFFGGVAADRVLILAFRHLNKPVRRKSRSRKPSRRRS